MQRTNIYLTDEQQDLLRDRARDEGVSKAELIRRLLDEALGLSMAKGDLLAAVEESAGVWADRTDEEIAEVFHWRTFDRFGRLGL